MEYIEATGTTTGISKALLKNDDIFLKELRNSAIKNEITIKSGIATTVNIDVFFKASKKVLF